jgi:hypothetical protein
MNINAVIIAYHIGSARYHFRFVSFSMIIF